MKAADVMVRHVVVIGPEDTVAEAAKLMAESDVSALPVVGADWHMVGIISEADLLRRVEIGTSVHHPWWLEAVTPAGALAEEFTKSHGMRVSEVMTTHVVTATEDTPLSEIATLLERHRIKRIPIVRGNELIGIVSRSNLVQALATREFVTDEHVDASRAIREEVLTRLKQQKWTDFGSRNVTVTAGEVHLWGLVGSEAEHQALIALAEGVPGVTGVIDEMIPAY